MGVLIELNSLVRIKKAALDPSLLKTGSTHTIVNDRERIIPLHIALLMIDDNWLFLGYCVMVSTEIKEGKTTMTLKVLTLFTPEEQKLYQTKFLEAAKQTGEA